MNRVHSATPKMQVTKENWQLEILMEKLRSKAAQFKPLPEISKNVRMTLLEKRYALDSVEKSQHQKCLDTLQHSIKVTCLQSMIERLESLTRQLGLRFVIESSGVFIFSDMFYLEIVLEPSGVVKDVKIHHEGKVEPQSCLELVSCLSRGDFADFTAQLEGFVSIYQLNAEKKVKSKAFTALESLEADLSTLAQLQMFIKEPFNLLHKSPVGLLEKRRGGHPMKLTYFVSPYELINLEKNDLDPINVETIMSKELGYGVTVCMEGSAAHKLQTTTLITVNRNASGKSTPSYSPLTSQNSAVIPACLVLKLNKPMPMCLSLVKRLQQIQPWSNDIDISPQPLLNLIVNHSSDGKLSCSNNRGLFVTLPDQNHCYFMTENKNMNGILVNSIPFTHPADVANILMILREQALFNTIISSCVRPNSKQDFENMPMFEISALSSTQISISLEHPLEESMATADIDLSDISSLVCRIQNPGTPPPGNATDAVSELATKVLNRSFSIPITIRAVTKMWEKQATRRTLYLGHENFNLPLGSIDPGGQKGPDPENGLSDYGGFQDKIKQEPGTHGQSQGGQHSMMLEDQQGVWNDSVMSSNFQQIPPSEGVLPNIELSNVWSDSSDKPCVKSQKRKATEELWRESKRKVGDNNEDPELTESSSTDSTYRSTPLSQETDIATPNSGSHSDVELSDLAATVDKGSHVFQNAEDIDDIEDLSNTSSDDKVKSRDKSPEADSITSKLEDKNLVPANVSITPISGSPTRYESTTLEKHPGIEIFPVSQSPSSIVSSSSITITPITSPAKYSDDKRNKKSNRSKEEKNRLEKKRKKRTEDSSMGPPDKVPSKQDPLLRPQASMTISLSESPPPSAISTPLSPNVSRAFSTSPNPNSFLPMSGKLSPSLTKSGTKSSSTYPSPKHSPAHVPNSPKYISGISSPKSHSTSPKHSSAGSSGKPSMTTLKNATGTSSSSKSSTEKSKSSKDGSREKDRSRSIFTVNNSNAKYSSTLKVRPLDLNINDSVQQDNLPSPSSDPKANLNQLRNRKGSLSAIVDKLKVNAQNFDVTTDLISKSSGNNNKDQTAPNKDGKSGAKTGEVKNSEYMVKPSSDGMKLTINKTRTKENKTSLSGSSSGGSIVSNNLNKTSSSTGSPKIHTGLKPGVNSGPASKKPQQLQKSSSGNISSGSANRLPNLNTNSSLKSSSNSSSINKQSIINNYGNSSGSKMTNNTGPSKTISKPSSSPKLNSSSVTDLSRSKDRLKPCKSSSEKSIFSSIKERGKSSPTPNDIENSFKIQPKVDPYASSLVMEGMMKTLDKNFQIPKLSARASEDKKKTDLNAVNRSTVDTKIFDMVAKNDIIVQKFPLVIPAMNSLDQKFRNNLHSMLGSGSKIKEENEGSSN